MAPPGLRGARSLPAGQTDDRAKNRESSGCEKRVITEAHTPRALEWGDPGQAAAGHGATRRENKGRDNKPGGRDRRDGDGAGDKDGRP